MHAQTSCPPTSSRGTSPPRPVDAPTQTAPAQLPSLARSLLPLSSHAPLPTLPSALHRLLLSVEAPLAAGASGVLAEYSASRSAAALEQGRVPGARIRHAQLTWRADGAGMGGEDCMPASMASWHASSGTLAVGCGVTTHAGWCRHRAGVALWHVPSARGAHPPASAPAAWRPLLLVHEESCVTSVALLHLSQYPHVGCPLRRGSGDPPLLLAVGTCTGSVAVHCVRLYGAGEPASHCLARSAAAGFHRDHIVSLCWGASAAAQAARESEAAEVAAAAPQQEESASLQLVSACAGGRVMLWRLPLEGSSALKTPAAAFQLRGKPVGARGAAGEGRGGAGGGGRRAGGGMALGLVCLAPLDLSSESGSGSRSEFVGATTDGVVRCRMLLTPAVAGEGGGPTLAPPPRRPQASMPGTAQGGESEPVAADNAKRLATHSDEPSLPWDPLARGVVAAAVASAICAPAARAAVERAAEVYAREVGDARVGLGALYASRPEGDGRLLLTPPLLQCAALPGGPRALAASPLIAGLYAAASGDGRLALHSAHTRTPLLLFDTIAIASARSQRRAAAATVSALAWCAVRPCLLAAGLVDGSVVLFDLFERTDEPVAQLLSNSAVVLTMESGAALEGSATVGGQRAGMEAGRSSSGEAAGRAGGALHAEASFDTPVAAICFSARAPGELVVVHSGGGIAHWRLPSPCLHVQRGETEALRRLMAPRARVVGARRGGGGAE